MKRGAGTSILAGYPWFSDWGRDAMISLPGLCLSTGRIEEAKSCLRTFVTASENGLVPNYFADDGGPANDRSVDATLWAIDAAGLLLDRGGDDARFVLDELFPRFEKAFESWESGTAAHGVRIDADGWLRAGDGSAALTWMDARIGSVPVTPRGGRPIEIEALFWRAMARLAAMMRRARQGEYQEKGARSRQASLGGLRARLLAFRRGSLRRRDRRRRSPGQDDAPGIRSSRSRWRPSSS